MAFDVMVPLKEALEKVRYDNSVRVVVLTGAGRGFSSGADHKSAGAVPNVDGLTRPTSRRPARPTRPRATGAQPWMPPKATRKF